MLLFRYYFERIRTSYWFVPGMMTLFAAAMAFAGVTLDHRLADDLNLELNWVYTGSADGARQLLATVAGSMITVAGVVFSITVVGLSLASSQFGPRLLRTFMRDRANQAVLGTFISTYVYCLLVLRAVRGGDEGDQFVPQLSITIGVALAIISVAVLIYFIHHTAVSLQAPVVIANVYGDLHSTIRHLFPDQHVEVDAESGTSSSDAFDEACSREIAADRSGYIESVDEDHLLKAASEHDLQVRVRLRPGHFVARRETLALVSPWSEKSGEDLETAIREAIVIGPWQTPLQDVEFVINQLVEVAVRALSPGINDPFTAVTCVDYLGAAICELASRHMPKGTRSDDDGTPRLFLNAITFSDLLETAFRQIRHAARTSPSVLIRMLENLARVVPFVHSSIDRTAALRQATLIHESAIDLQACDAEALLQRFTMLEQVCVAASITPERATRGERVCPLTAEGL